ncbi:MAG: helicase-related protein [bacterium]
MVDLQTREKFADFVMGRIIDRATGRCEFQVLDDKPCRKFFIGTLFPRMKERGASKVFTKISPSEVGIEGLIDEDSLSKATLWIRVAGAFYQRVFPTYGQQINVSKKVYPPLSAEEEERTPEMEPQAQKFRAVYEKRPLAEVLIERDLSNLVKGKLPIDIELPELSSAVEKLKRSASDFPNAFLNIKDRNLKKIPKEALKDEESYIDFIRSIEGDHIEPIWNLKCRLKISHFRGKIKISVHVENVVEQDREPENIDSTFFECKLEAELVNAVFQPYVLDYLRDDYKYDGNIDANGINCCAVKKKPNVISCEHIPIFRQRRHKSTAVIQPSFKELAKDPIPVLQQIEKAMTEYLNHLSAMYNDKSSHLTEKGKNQFEQDINDFKRDAVRFRQGVACLETDDDLGRAMLDAFKMMNEAFASSSKEFTSWRLFQIVFITMMVPEIAAVHKPNIPNFRDYVDVVYFPTGGGKTEAYLGVVVLQMFFDRLIGKKFGVSAVTRFPLRLLSIQQLQRIGEIFAQAEKIRRKHNIIGKDDCAPFSTGYFVGEGNTPNRVYKVNTPYDKVDLLTPINEGGPEKERYRIITQCPFCGSDRIELHGDLDHLQIKHICRNPACGEELPVYISDYEIFRYLPTFIIGTVDKSAACGMQRFFRHIFGQVTHRCPDHGFFSGGCCLQREDCSRKSPEMLPVSTIDITPSLLIQDEMHLIRESLGSYSSHYESFFDEYIKRLTDGKKRLKIIAATATISRYGHQLEQLYRRKGYQFPSPGPDISKSFYAYWDETETGRLIAGVMPHGKTIIYAVLDILMFYREEIQRFLNNPMILIDAGLGFENVEDVKDVLRDYNLMLSYNLVKLEGDAVYQSIKTMVNPRLREEGFEEISPRNLTGDVTFSDVKEVLSIIENPSGEERIDLITATSMISHGVDIDSMNFMVFRGMPRNNAEYIQASSRVGRKYPGLIFIVFNHTRERDQSYYRYFIKFHQFQDMLVEPVPINRWAKFSINRTLPGIFCAALLNYYEPMVVSQGQRGLYTTRFFSDAYAGGFINERELKNFIQTAYGTEDSDLAHHFKDFIDLRVDQYISEILDKRDDSKAFIANAISDPPMKSLRDTDIPIEVSPTRESFDPMECVGSTRTRREE